MNNFTFDTKLHDSITIDFYMSALSTNIAQLIKQDAKPIILENYEEAIVIEKDLHAIGVINNDESVMDSKDASRKSQAMASKVRDKEATDIETLTCLVKNLIMEVFELKQGKTDTSASIHTPKHRHTSSSSSSNWFAPKIVQKSVFQVENCTNPKFCSFH